MADGYLPLDSPSRVPENKSCTIRSEIQAWIETRILETRMLRSTGNLINILANVNYIPAFTC